MLSVPWVPQGHPQCLDPDHSDVDPAVVGAFLSGVGAVIGSTWSVRRIRRTLERECRDRIQEVKDAIEEGYRLRGK